jgi:hypothetical protein
MTPLPDIQRLLWRLITAPEGVGDTLAAADARGDDARVALARTVRDHGALSAVQRLDVYANMYFFRLLDVLADDYPAVRAVVGPTGFHNLVTDYLLAHPPAHFSVRYAGQYLPEFVVGQRIAAEYPYLHDLATLERSIIDAFDAPDAPTLAPADLAAVPPTQWSSLRLRVHPSVRLHRLDWPVHLVREQVDRGEDPSRITATDTALFVWRHDLQVRQCAVSAGEWQALDVLRQGGDFASACAAAAGELGDGATAAAVAQALADWLAAGMLSGLRTEV